MRAVLPPVNSLKIMLEAPGAKYINHGGKELYVTLDDGRILMIHTGADYTEMSYEEIDIFVSHQLGLFLVEENARAEAEFVENVHMLEDNR